MPARSRWLLLILIGLVIVAAGVSIVLRRLERNAASGRLRIDDAELNYVTILRDRLKGQSNPETQSSVSLFLSASAINSVLSGANELNIDVPGSGGTSVLIHSVQAKFSDGFPEIVAKVTVSRANPRMSVEAVLTNVLEPRLDKSDTSLLLFYIYPLSIDAGLPNQIGSKPGNRVLSDLLSKLALAFSDQLPHFTVPLSREFDVAFPSAQVALPVPTQAGKLNGELDIPGLSFHSALSLSGLMFLSDGIHIYLSAAVGPPANQVVPALLPYLDALKPRGYATDEQAKSLIKSEEAQIVSAQADLGRVLLGMKVSGADFRVWTSKDLLSQVAAAFNNLTPDQRRIHYHTLSEEGQLYRAGGGGFGCGGYAELVGGNSANGNLQIGNLATSWKPGDGFAESAEFQFTFDAQVTGHINGTAGPHPTWVLNCVHIPWPINKDACTNLPSVTVSCETPIGGGIGLGSYGIHEDRTERLTAAVSLHSDNSSWLVYDLKLISPDQVPITIQVGLGQLGTLGLPFTFGIPHQVLMSGKAPLLFNQSGVIESSRIGFSKKYLISATPTSGSVSTDGYFAVGTIKVQWQ